MLAQPRFMQTKNQIRPTLPNGSKINTPKIGVNRGLNFFAVAIKLSQRLYLIPKYLCDSHSYGEGADIGKFDAAIDAKKSKKRVR